MQPVLAPNKTVSSLWARYSKQKLTGLSIGLDRTMPGLPKYPRAVTITLHPFFHDKKDICVLRYAYNVLGPYCKSKRISIWLCPELTEAGNLHWHGMAHFPDQYEIAKFNKYIATRFGRQWRNYLVEHETEAYDYCVKEQELMLSKHPMYRPWCHIIPVREACAD